MEWCGNTKNGHDDSLVFLVDKDLHFPDVFFPRHLGDVLIGHIGFSGPERDKRKVDSIKTMEH